MVSQIVLIVVLVFGQLAIADNKADALKGLGFSESDLKPSADLQKTLDDRRYYLKQHQVWGLIAAGTMVAAFVSGGEESLPPEHPYFAGLAVASYAASAVTSWLAPDVPSAKISGGSAWHRRLVYIHLPGMILTPILGYMAAKKFEKSEGLDTPEKYHRDVAGITAGTLVLSAILVSFEF